MEHAPGKADGAGLVPRRLRRPRLSSAAPARRELAGGTARL